MTASHGSPRDERRTCRYLASLFLFLFFILPNAPHAAIEIVVRESSGDVVATATGSANTDGLTFGTNTSGDSLVFGSATGPSWWGAMYLGSGGRGDYYLIDTEINFSSGGVFDASSTSGAGWVGFVSGRGSTADRLYVPTGYVSGQALSATSTWAGATFASLGLITGIYEIRWGSGANADRLTLYVGTSPPVTEFSIGGSVNGASGALTLSLNNAENLVVGSNGDFEFSTKLRDGDTYEVVVESAPAGQFCSIANEAGTVVNANVSDVLVTCSDDPPATRFDLYLGVNPARIDTLTGELNLLEIAVSNRGPDTARAALLTLDYAGGLGFDSLPGGCAPVSATRIQCTLGDVDSGPARLLSPRLRFLAPAPGNLLQVSVTADGDETSPSDNGVDTLVIARTPAADLRPAVSAQGLPGPDGPVLFGRPLRLSVGAANAGPATARSVLTRTVLPPDWVIDQPATGCSGVIENGATVLVCNLGDIPPPPAAGPPVVKSLENVLIVGNGGIPLLSTVSSSTVDPNSNNDSAELLLDVRSESRDVALTARPAPTVRLGQRELTTFGFDLSLDGPFVTGEVLEVEIRFPRAGVNELDVSELVAEGYECDTSRSTGTDWVFDCELDGNAFLVGSNGDIEFSARFTEVGTFVATAEVTTSKGLDEQPANNRASLQLNVQDTPPLDILAIEVTQAVQNWENQVDLYKNKRTVVRVFVRDEASWIDSSSPYNRGRLVATTGRGDLILDTELEASTGFRAVSDPGAPYRRNNPDAILEFLLPSDWTQVSDLRLTYEPVTYGRPVRCLEPDTVPDCQVRVSFREPVRPRATWFRLGYWDDDLTYVGFERTDSDGAPDGTFSLSIAGEDILDLPIRSGAATIRSRVEAAARRANQRIVRAIVRPARYAPGGFPDPGDDNVVGYYISLTTTVPGYDIANLRLLGVDAASGSVTGSSRSLSDSGTFHQPTFRELNEQRKRIRGLLPTDRVLGFSRQYPVIWDFKPSTQVVNNSLLHIRAMEIFSGVSIADEHFYAAFQPGVPPAWGLGSGQSRGVVLNWYDSGRTGENELTVSRERDALGYARHTGAHEFYHALGKGHAGVVDLDEIEGDGKDPDTQRGVCNSRGRLGQTKHPYVERLPGVEFDDRAPGFDRDEYPTLGPLGLGTRRQIWGYATRFFGTASQLRVVDPFATSELMDYCNIKPDTRTALANGSFSDHVRWPSSFSYLAAAIGLREGFTGAENGTDFSGAILSVSGFLGVPEYGVEPFFGDLPAQENSESGPVTITLVDGQGQTVDAVSVATLPSFVPDLGTDRDPSSIPPQPDSFFALLRNPRSAGRTLIVSEDGLEVGRVVASDNAPEVRLLSPAGGPVDTSGIVVRWQASDADGDELSADVLYSADDGVTWKVVGADITGTHRFIPSTGLAGSSRGRIRVIVSDGFLATEVTSPPLAVPDTAPTVAILSSLPDVLADGTPLLLEAEAFDNEDGELDTASLQWASSLQGTMGSGSPLYLMPGTLQPGCHLLSVQATDSNGATGTARAALGVGEPCDDQTTRSTLRIRTVTNREGPGATALQTSDPSRPLLNLVAGETLDIPLPPGAINLIAPEAFDAAGGGYTCSDPSGNTLTGLSPGLAQVSLDPGETVVCDINLGELFRLPGTASETDAEENPTGIPMLPAWLQLLLAASLAITGARALQRPAQ